MPALQLLHVRGSAAVAGASGPPVLLIHSFPSDSDSDWGGWTQALAAVGRQACLVDLPGHGAGATAPDGAATTTSRIVGELERVIDTLGGRADVVGYSLGARLAWELPRRGRVRRLVLGGIAPVDPFAGVDAGELERFATDAVTPRDPKTARLAARIAQPGLNTTGLARCIAGLAAEPFAASPDSAPRVPTLFVAGADDALVQGLDSVVAMSPAASLLSVPGDHRGALLGAPLRAAVLRFLTSG